MRISGIGIQNDSLMRREIISVSTDWLPWVKVAALCELIGLGITAFTFIVVLHLQFELVDIEDI